MDAAVAAPFPYRKGEGTTGDVCIMFVMPEVLARAIMDSWSSSGGNLRSRRTHWRHQLREGGARGHVGVCVGIRQHFPNLCQGDPCCLVGVRGNACMGAPALLLLQI
jgi:hypothetical protein